MASWTAIVSSSGLGTAPVGVVQFQQHGRGSTAARGGAPAGDSDGAADGREPHVPIDALYSGDLFSDPSSIIQSTPTLR